MESIRITILSTHDVVCARMDNEAPDALHYYDDELHSYLEGTANTFSFKAPADHEDAQYLTVGNKLAFQKDGRDYYLNIVQSTQDEEIVDVMAYSLSFELLNEENTAYKAPKAMSFAEYLAVFDWEKTVTLGINEVSDKRISHEWTGSDTILARIFSLANVFSAEAEFVPVLNPDFSLQKIVLNVYKQHSDTVQGIGQNRTDERLRYGVNIEGITKTSDITELFTAIRPFGRDNLTVTSLAKTEYDENGNVEYMTAAGNRNILAPQARDRFPSNLLSSANDRYIAKVWNYDTDNVNTLYGQALAELKKGCVPKLSYEVDGYVDAHVGDTFTIIDEEFNPPLYLQARVKEQVESLTDETKNKTTFSNYEELQSQIDPELLQQVNNLIAANRVYTCSVISSNGIVFKNGEGSTTLIAVVKNGGLNIADQFNIQWYKDGEELSLGAEVTVNAADVPDKVTYRFEATDSGGIFRGQYEVTVSNVNDGEKGADGEPGKAGEDGVSPIIKVNPDTSLTITDKNGEQTTPTLKGEDGTRGSEWYAGDKLLGTSTDGMIFPESGISDARVNDRYVNPFTGNLYACVRAGAADVAKWAYIGNIKGPKGDQGEKGDAGKIEVSDTEPEEKTEGMLWKHTGTVEGLIQNATYRWDGSTWQLYKFVAENIEVDQLSAITADLGIVNAGQINGVEINGSEFNNPFHSNRYYLDSAGKWQLTRTVDGTASLKDGTLTFSGIAHESGHDYKTVVSYGDDKTLIQMYDGAGADANLISETRIVEGVPYIRKEDGTYYSLFDNYVTCSGAVMNSDVTIKPRGSAGDNGHLKFPSGNNGLTGYIGSCNNTLRMYGFNSSGTYKDAYLQLTDGSFYVTGGIKAKGGDVTNSSGQTLGGAYNRSKYAVLMSSTVDGQDKYGKLSQNPKNFRFVTVIICAANSSGNEYQRGSIQIPTAEITFTTATTYSALASRNAWYPFIFQSTSVYTGMTCWFYNSGSEYRIYMNVGASSGWAKAKILKVYGSD
nr:MAG TPA: tail protein [Caudoviricetes sp.]